MSLRGTWHDLSRELRQAILDLVPPKERVHTCRLVCREWALAPLRHAHVRSVESSAAVLRLLSRASSASFLRFHALRELEVDCSDAGLLCAALMNCATTLERLCVHGHVPHIMTTLCSDFLPALRRLAIGSERYDLPWKPWTVLELACDGFGALEEFEVVGPRRGPGLKIHFTVAPPRLRRVVLSHVERITFVRGADSLCPDTQLVIKEQALRRAGSSPVRITLFDAIHPLTVSVRWRTGDAMRMSDVLNYFASVEQ